MSVCTTSYAHYYGNGVPIGMGIESILSFVVVSTQPLIPAVLKDRARLAAESLDRFPVSDEASALVRDGSTEEGDAEQASEEVPECNKMTLLFLQFFSFALRSMCFPFPFAILDFLPFFVCFPFLFPGSPFFSVPPPYFFF